MKKSVLLSSLFIAGLCAASLHAQGNDTSSRIVSAGLFKNGVAVVKQEVAVGGRSKVTIPFAVEPVHGTFWFDMNDAVESAKVSTRDVPLPASDARVTRFEDLAELYGGKKVRVYFKDPGRPGMEGVIVKPDTPGPAEGALASQPRPTWWGYWHPSANQPEEGASPIFLLQQNQNLTYVSEDIVGMVEIIGSTQTPTLTRKEPYLEIQMKPDLQEKPEKIEVSYLARGLSWAPSYRLDLLKERTLRLRQKAIVKNELADLDNCEMELISGFPNVPFAHVAAPLAPGYVLQNFFNALAMDMQQQGGVTTNAMLTRQRIPVPDISGGGSDSALPQVDGVSGSDLYYAWIGSQSLSLGDTLVVNTASETATYERIVEWRVPDSRDAWGNPLREYQLKQTSEEDTPWDAVRFNNPFEHPLTTGPVSIMSDGRFAGQSHLTWTNPGQEVVARVNKALSVHGNAWESEVQGARRNLGGNVYQTTVEGNLKVVNYRDEAITLSIRKRISGEFIKSSDQPGVRLLEEGVGALNPRSELIWEVDMPPNTQHTIKYTYEVLAKD